MRTLKAQKKQIMLVVLASIAMFALMVGRDCLMGRSMIAEGIPRGLTQEDIYQETFVVEGLDGIRQEVAITVYPQMLAATKQQELLSCAVNEFEEVYLGDNQAADQVSGSLVFPQSFCEGMVQAYYVTSHPELIWEDGGVTTEGVGNDGTLVDIFVTFTCQDATLEYTCHVRVVLPILSEVEQARTAISSAIEEEEQKTRSQERFVLPTNINGQEVSWRKKMNVEPFIFLLLGGVAVIAVLQKNRQDANRCRRQREQALMQEYPQMVSKLSMLIGAGMNVSVAWERMAKRYLKEQVREDTLAGNKKYEHLEEMVITYKEIRDGVGIRKAYENFANRVGVASYRKMIALLLQNMDKGNRDLIRLLDQEAYSALTEQKNQIRKQGEEAGTKLLFPMLLLFVMILVIIMVPAMLSF